MVSIAIPFRWSRTRRRRTRSVFLAIFHGDARPWNVSAFVLLAVLVIGYLAITNSNAAAGFELRSRERHASELREEVRRLELQSLDAQSLNRIEAQIVDKGYVPVAGVRYLIPGAGAVVRR